MPIEVKLADVLEGWGSRGIPPSFRRPVGYFPNHSFERSSIVSKETTAKAHGKLILRASFNNPGDFLLSHPDTSGFPAQYHRVSREIERNDRALFFANAAWILSRYPVFAFNAGLLSIHLGDIDRGKQFLTIFIDEHESALTNESFRLLESDVTADELERLTEKARRKLAVLETKLSTFSCLQNEREPNW